MANAPFHCEFIIFPDMVIDRVTPETFLVLISVNIFEDEVHEVRMHAILRQHSAPECAHARLLPRHVKELPYVVFEVIRLRDVDSDNSACTTPYLLLNVIVGQIWFIIRI